MAKSKKPAGQRSRGPAGTLDQIAEGVGTAIGAAQHQAEHWLSDPKQMLSHITSVRDAANRLIAQLTGGAAAFESPKPAAAATRTGTRKRKPPVRKRVVARNKPAKNLANTR